MNNLFIHNTRVYIFNLPSQYYFFKVKFMDAVKAKRAFPIHWGTFPLTSEPVFEPRNKLVAAMKEAGKDESTFSASLIGETTLYE